MYKFSAENSIIRTLDGASIPLDPTNKDYLEYLQWVEQGNVAEPYVATTPTILEQIAALEAQISVRRLRESIISDDGKTWLANIDAEIADLRGQL